MKITLRETEILGYMSKHPELSRGDVIITIARTGPWRIAVEQALSQLALRKAAPA